MQSHGKDIKGATLSYFAGIGTTATAAGSGDATEVVGDTIDLEALSSRPSSVVFEIPVKSVLADTETCVLVGDLEKSADGSTWSSLVASATLLTLTGETGGTTEKGVARMGADLIQTNCRYIRCNYTPELSASGTDTAALGGAVAVFGGLDET